MTALRLYTDGSYAAPVAVSGWAWILVSEHAVASSRSGATPGSSTHMAAELAAAIEGLAYLVASGVREVELLSDSRYLVRGMSSNGRTGWAHAAAEREWRTTHGKPLANRDLWERLLELEGCLAVTWRHVRGHRPKKDTSDDARYNREVDALAGEGLRGACSASGGMNTRMCERALARNGCNEWAWSRHDGEHRSHLHPHKGKKRAKVRPGDRCQENEKAPFPGLFEVAGAGFEPATSGL